MQTQLAAVAARNGGPFTRSEALSCGYTPKAIEHRLRNGRWRRLRPGIYAEHHVIGACKDPPQRHALHVAAAVLAQGSGDTAGSHHSAAFIYGFALLRKPKPEVTVTRTPRGRGRAARAGVHVHPAALPAEHVRKEDGVALTSPARTVIDLARALTYEESVVLADSALRQGHTSRHALDDVLRYCRTWPGISRASRAVRFADPHAESALESLARLLFATYGLPPPQTQVILGDDWEAIARVDFYWPEYGIVGEADGMLKYDNRPHALRAEKLRQERLAEAGYEVVRFTWDDVVYRPRQTVERIRAAFARGAAKRAGRGS